jgi:hypothetical protein
MGLNPINYYNLIIASDQNPASSPAHKYQLHQPFGYEKLKLKRKKKVIFGKNDH